MLKPTDSPFWQAARPSPRPMCVLPVPELPTAIQSALPSEITLRRMRRALRLSRISRTMTGAVTRSSNIRAAARRNGKPGARLYI